VVSHLGCRIGFEGSARQDTTDITDISAGELSGRDSVASIDSELHAVAEALGVGPHAAWSDPLGA
jgi:hypothetical protein